MNEGVHPSEDEAIEDAARRIHRLDAAMGGVGFFASWESVPESVKERYRAQARKAREDGVTADFSPWL
jgi:hypothetical protein